MCSKLENSEILENGTEKLIINGEQIIIGPNWCLITVLEEVKNYKMRCNSKEPKHCILCGTPFTFGQKRRTICLCRLFISCGTCHVMCEKGEISKRMKEAINNGKEIIGYCSNKCQSTAIYKLTLGKTLKEDPEKYAGWCKSGGDASAKWAEENPELAYERNKKGGDASAKWFNEHPELKRQRNVNGGKATQEFYKEHPEILHQLALNWQAGSVKAHLENGEEWNKNIGKGLKRAYQNDPTLAEAKSKILREYWAKEENKPRLILNLGPWANGGNLKPCEKCNRETPHNINDECRCCIGELMWCDACNCFGKVETHSNPVHATKNIYCKECDRITPHNKDAECRCCLGELMWCEDCQVFGKPEIHNNPVHRGKKIFCEECNKETPHYDNANCRCCSGELMWCETCKIFGKVETHSDPYHTLFYKSKTKEWILEHPEELESINWSLINIKGEILENFNELIDAKPCIYGWFVKIPEVDDKLNLETTEVPIYIGQSVEISSRILDHLYAIYHTPEYYAYKKEIGIELRILEEFDDSNLTNDQIKLELDVAELNWIDKLKPWSQKCNGTDSIKPLYERDSLPWMD